MYSLSISLILKNITFCLCTNMFFSRKLVVQKYVIGSIGSFWVRNLSKTCVVRLNPLLPIDPTEILSNIDKEENEKKENAIRETRGRIKNILKNTKSNDTTYSRKEGNNLNVGNNNDNNNKDDEDMKQKRKEQRRKSWNEFLTLLKRCSETGLITLSSLAVLVLGGIVYHKLYKQNVLWKMDESFNKNESLLLVKHQDNLQQFDKDLWAERSNQKLLDSIITGEVKGKYYLLLGEKGTGKTSAVMESISRVKGKDCAVVDCSSDIELMRLRIGSALNFEFFEDYIGSLFSMKGPRESTPILDIERAFMKLETILIQRRSMTKKPLILIFNNSHLVDSSLVELLQQKAENFSSSGMLTMLFISDDYWLFEKLKILSTRLQVINFEDTKLKEATKILKSSRIKHFKENLTDEQCLKIYHMIGGRPQHLNHVASNKDMLKAANELIDAEKLWFLNNCALLGADMDDDVMESGKFATSAMLLMRELVEMDRIRKEKKNLKDVVEPTKLPQLPLWRARQVMTRPDYIEEYDKLNIFTIGTDSNVRADSVPMMRAFHEIASHPNFDDILRETIDRISEIESLHRTRELIFKNLASGGTFKIKKDSNDDSFFIKMEKQLPDEALITMRQRQKEEIPDSIDHDDHHEGERKKWWKRRLETYTHKSAGEGYHYKFLDESEDKGEDESKPVEAFKKSGKEDD
jgi:hypothetical protein